MSVDSDEQVWNFYVRLTQRDRETLRRLSYLGDYRSLADANRAIIRLVGRLAETPEGLERLFRELEPRPSDDFDISDIGDSAIPFNI